MGANPAPGPPCKKQQGSHLDFPPPPSRSDVTRRLLDSHPYLVKLMEIDCNSFILALVYEEQLISMCYRILQLFSKNLIVNIFSTMTAPHVAASHNPKVLPALVGRTYAS